MKISIIKRINRFFRTTAVGGLAAVLPLGLVVVIIRWIISLIQRYLGPLVEMVHPSTKIQAIVLYIILIEIILCIFFFIGLIVQTRMRKTSPGCHAGL